MRFAPEAVDWPTLLTLRLDTLWPAKVSLVWVRAPVGHFVVGQCDRSEAAGVMCANQLARLTQIGSNISTDGSQTTKSSVCNRALRSGHASGYKRGDMCVCACVTAEQNQVRRIEETSRATVYVCPPDLSIGPSLAESRPP
jgi:hypothetical protein